MEQSRLRELETQCIQDWAPPCAAQCPVHVDIRQMARAIAIGDFNAGMEVLTKAIPFPGIIAYTCDRPCQAKCNREKLGGVVQVSSLEKACVGFAEKVFPKITPLPNKKFHIAILGAGLSSLTAAFDLARKGYQVDLYEQTDHLGGQLWNFPEAQLPRAILSEETGLILRAGVEIHLDEHISLRHRIFEQADAIYLGAGKSEADFSYPSIGVNESFQVNSDTFQTTQNKIFAGGSLIHPYSSIQSVSDGRRAAISIDRFLQKVSLTASRSNEGVYQTRLYTNLTGITPVEMVKAHQSSHKYTKEEAQAEARRCLQCECMECVKACEYLKHYGSYPKKYVREIYNNMSMLVRARTSNTFINSCALCGLCGEVCPNDLNMGGVNLETRQEMVKTSRMPAATHDFALLDMAFSNGEKFALARNAPGFDSSSYVFFPGCQLSGSSPQYVEKAYAVLQDTFQKDGAGVGLMLRCCGAPAEWAGRQDLFAHSQAEFWIEYKKLGEPKVILTCSSCYSVFQKHYPGVEILSFWDIYDQYGPQQFPRRDFPAPFAIHDPCSTRYESHIQDSVRSILMKVGCDIRELPLNREKTECCSYGGLMWLANKIVAEQVVQRRIQESPLDYVTYCAMCRDFFARREKRTLHLFDLLFGMPGIDLTIAPPVGWSQRHENRTRLKEKLLQDLWSENMPEQRAFESIRLVLPQRVQQMVEERLILIEDMQKVIDYAERTGKRLFNSTMNHYLAYYKPNSITYWVEYTPQEDGTFLVHKAYSHRMEIGTRVIE